MANKVVKKATKKPAKTVAKKPARKAAKKASALKRIGAGNRMSEAVIHGGKAYLAGFVAEAAAGKSVKEQTADILAQIDATLKQAGTDKTRILKANIWLTDIGTWAEMNEAWDAWAVPGQTPARATVESKLAAPGLDVEIMVEAAI
ncbi:RidA family protein [Aestuariivirga sp.]|uniref:RidA family protein n=1 Tax=Aestuariivirga sp. TaxID=2650926 RepID=UPI0039E4F16B